MRSTTRGCLRGGADTVGSVAAQRALGILACGPVVKLLAASARPSAPSAGVILTGFILACGPIVGLLAASEDACAARTPTRACARRAGRGAPRCRAAARR